ncbi:uncharacterized protein MONBRDRAFT_25944 [Monosiga brevicollis MX1]|uniref:Reverse transcriptase domain-containing protein n=1 Tax=Monosiga brevicollis TaxID=81824 RepID=A9V0X7_MONBE|nr:uncharacterized protein MONBRDRAFT_25944 [Monosiga brevicollis MX1]EDQ88710.1 predicted protein [Monosiga brevicollis MX1]|eukprot:XP_001746323.1 hypothetical protein [Monosiga brevicollis MX1]
MACSDAMLSCCSCKRAWRTEIGVCELLKLARHPLMQRSRYPSSATETKLMAATLSQLYWSAGNELSPFFFALYSCEVLGLLDATTDYRCKIIKYLDDIVLMGPAEDVAADVEIVKARAESAGLHLQPSKSRFYMPHHHSASIAAIKSVLPDAVRETANTGMTVLGTPIGRREWMKKQLNDKAKHITGKLNDLKTPPKLSLRSDGHVLEQNDMLTTGVSLQALLTAMQYVPSLINHLYTLPPGLTSGLSELLNRACKDTFVKAFFAKVNLSAPAGAEGHDVTLEQLLEARLFTRANTGGFGLHDLVERGPVAYVCNMAKLATRYPRVYDRLLEDESRAADFEAHVQRAGFQMATVKDAATQIIALRSKAALDDLMAKCALDLQQAYLASREWGVSTVLTMRGRDKLRRLSDTTFAIAVVSMMGFGLHELINIKPTDKCPLCSSKTPQPRLTREHLLTCRPIKRHNALRDEMGRLLRYATLSHVWVEKSGYNANGQSCRIDLHCRNPFPGGALGPALPDLGIDVTVRTAQPPTTSQACIKVGAALRRAEKEKREYYTGFNHGKTLIVPAAMTTTGGFASSFVDLLGQLARCAEARGVYQPGLDEAFVPRWKGRFAALVHQMNADHIQRHFGGVCLRSSMLLSAPSTALSTIDLRNMFHDRLRWLVTGQLGRVVDAMRKAVARKQSRRGQLNAGAGAHPNDAVDQSLRSLVRDPDLADEAWANHVTNRLNRGQIAKAFDADKARAVIGNSEVQAVRDLLVPPGLTPYIASTPASTSTLAPATAVSSPTVSFTKGELPKALAATKGVTDPYGWSGELLASIYRIKEHFSQVLGPRQGSTSDPTAPSDGDAPQGPTTATGGPQVALNKIFHHIANNTVPESIRHALCSINYTILEKANGKFRPVGTDSIFNKVVNRALLELLEAQSETGPRLDRKAWVNHVLREHPYDEQATDLVKQVMEAKLVAQCNKFNTAPDVVPI